MPKPTYLQKEEALKIFLSLYLEKFVNWITSVRGCCDSWGWAEDVVFHHQLTWSNTVILKLLSWGGLCRDSDLPR